MMKRWLAILLVFTFLLPYTVFAREAEKAPREITEAEYALVEEMWQEMMPGSGAKRAANSNTAMEIASVASKHELYKPNSLRWNGNDQFTFETTVGVTCGYSARLHNIALQAKQTDGNAPETEVISYASKNAPFGKDVYLIEPYYQIDESFTTQYQNEAKSIAQATGGTYHLYTKTAATIDAVAEAVGKGAVVIFDSHGDTDFARGDDYTSGATTSYLLLQTGEGLTEEDYMQDNGTYHAIYYGSYGSMKYYAVDGTCIANHMGAEAPHSLVWMAICLGMATDGLQKPLRENGVEVVYGYSQSVTFDYDYLWEETFFDELRAQKTVAEAIAKMKKEVGLWDYCDYYNTISEARAFDCAFPIVVSSEDVYPGQGNVDALQTVYSTWTLFAKEECLHETTEQFVTEPTCVEQGSIMVVCTGCGEIISEEISDPLGHDFVMNTLLPTCTEQGYDLYSCNRCGDYYQENFVETIAHTFENDVCVFCGALCPCADFTDVSDQNWFHDAVVFAYVRELMNGVGNGKFDPEGSVTRAMLVTILYRSENCPSIDGLTNPFADVASGQWYYDAVIWAANEGIVNGVNATTFAPDVAITREQIATILHRYSGAENMIGSLDEFADASQISDYAIDAIVWAVHAGLINGIDGLLAPTQTATRAQIATLLMRYLQMA